MTTLEHEAYKTKYDTALEVLHAGEPAHWLARSARDCAEAAYQLACIAAAAGDPDESGRWLHAAAEAYAVLFTKLLVRDGGTVVRYVIAGSEVEAEVALSSRVATPRLLAKAVLCCWAVGAYEDAGAIGSVPTQLYRAADDAKDEIGMYWAFALASIARGNILMFHRNAENLREIDAKPRGVDTGELRGLLLHALAALEAALEGKTKNMRRRLDQAHRFHIWQHRADNDNERSLDLTVLGIESWSKRPGALEKPATVG